MQNTTTVNILRIGDFSVYQLQAGDDSSYVVWDHHNGAYLPDLHSAIEFTHQDAVDLAREYESSAPADRPTYLGS
jgi:hypothetical protein